jgi:hypothetical protein
VEAGKLRVQLPDIYSGETKRVLVHLRVPASVKAALQLGTGEFRCTDITSGKPQIIAQSFAPSIQVIEDQQMVLSNFDHKVQAKVASITASQSMEAAYKEYEQGNQVEAQRMATDANEKLKALGYLENQGQSKRYESFIQTLNTPAAAAPEYKKDVLKKQKEAERTVQQSVPQ